jgi:hypothetical protein
MRGFCIMTPARLADLRRERLGRKASTPSRSASLRISGALAPVSSRMLRILPDRLQEHEAAQRRHSVVADDKRVAPLVHHRPGVEPVGSSVNMFEADPIEQRLDHPGGEVLNLRQPVPGLGRTALALSPFLPVVPFSG